MDVFWLQKFQWKVLWSVQGSPVSWKFLHHRRKNDFQRCWISVGLCSWRLKKRKVPIRIEIISRFAKFEQIRYSYSRMLLHKALFRLDDGCTEIPVAVVFCSTRSDNESEGGDSGRLNQQSDEIWLWSIICYCKFAFSEKLFCSKFKRNLFANNSHEKKAAHFFVIQNGDPSSNSHDSHHLLQEKRSQDDLGCSMNVFYGFPSFPACGMTPPEVLDLHFWGDESWDAERLALGMFFLFLGASCMKI